MHTRAAAFPLAVLVGCLAPAAPAQRMTSAAKACFDQAFECMRRGDVVPAIAKYEEALALAPDNADILVEYVAALRRGRRYQQSVRSGWRLVELRPADHGGWGNLGNTLVEAGAHEAALFAYEKAAAAARDKGWAAQNLLNLGFQQCLAGDAKAAMRVFAKALKLDPQNGAVFADIGFAHALQGQTELAKQALDKALALLRGQGDPRSQAAMEFARMLRQEVDRAEPQLPHAGRGYCQQLPKALLRQPGKGKAGALAVAAEVQHGFRLDDGQTCSFVAPEPWPLLIGDDPLQATSAPTLTLHSPQPGRFQLLLTLAAEDAAEQDLRALVQEIGEHQLRGAVETSLVLHELKSATVQGCYFSLQDGKLVGKQPPPGEFPFVVQGILRAGRVRIAFTLLTMDRGDAALAAPLAVLRSAADQPPGQ